jgi:hypothetical protein
MRVEFLFWAGCPSHPEALGLLQEVLSDLGLHPVVDVHEVTSQEDADRLAFPGSPTIRVDGRDVDPDGAAGKALLTCRIYRLADGRVSPVPTRETLEAALR